jgi:hypothetical protein
MSRMGKKVTLTAMALTAAFAVLFAPDRSTPTGVGLISTAEARIGRPLTPMSYAGVARRTTRRAVAVGAAGAAAAGAAYYGSGCYQAVDAYGRVYNRC